ncbi:MAG: energy transducer TonB [Chitinophagaceae bacterium]|nr:energy transducer TonB [Chitinophagaceae bacterium]
MEVNKILKSDILDIIFEGRNKEYGAYELRKTYKKRITFALLFTIVISALFYISTLFFSGKESKGNIIIEDVSLEKFEQEEKKPEPPPPPPPPKPEPPKVEITKFTPPKIVKDEEVKPEEKPPEVEKLEETKIGTINQIGDKDKGIVEAPKEVSTGVAPVKVEEDYDRLFTSVQIESEFPGGQEAWNKYLQRNLNSEVPKDNGAPSGRYTVEVSFTVDKEGNISSVSGILANGGSNDYGTIEEAIRVIKRGPKWKPGVQNGIQVKSRKKQRITFLITED